MVVQRELNSLPECLLACNLMVIEWTTAITGDCMGLFWDFSLRRKIWRTIFDEAAPETLIKWFVFLYFDAKVPFYASMATLSIIYSAKWL